jgi:hypothetical protein
MTTDDDERRTTAMTITNGANGAKGAKSLKGVDAR